MLLYRFIVAAYTLSWQIYNIVELGGDVDTGSGAIPAGAFLTNWTYFVLTLYLFLHFVVSLSYAINRGRQVFKIPAREQHRRLFHELQVQPSLWGSNQYEIVHGTGSDTEDERREVAWILRMGWQYKIVWILYNVASSGCLMVTLIFWIMLYPQLGKLEGIGLYINLQLHAITSIIIFIEHFISAVPIRFLHVIYTLIYGLIYVIFSVIFYEVRSDHPVIYPGVLDFAHPGRTAAVLAVTALVLLPLIQVFLFAFYKLKLLIYGRLVNPDTS